MGIKIPNVPMKLGGSKVNMSNNKQYKVAVVGATGAVGQKISELLEEEPFAINDLELLSSKRSAGKKLTVACKELTIEEAVPKSFENIDIAIVSAGCSVSETLLLEAVKRVALAV